MLTSLCFSGYCFSALPFTAGLPLRPMEHSPLSLKFLCYLATLCSPKRTIKSYQPPPLCPSRLFLIFNLPRPLAQCHSSHYTARTHLASLSPPPRSGTPLTFLRATSLPLSSSCTFGIHFSSKTGWLVALNGLLNFDSPSIPKNMAGMVCSVFIRRQRELCAAWSTAR